MIGFTLWSESLSLEFPTSLPDTQRIWSAILTFTFPIPQNNFHFPSSPQRRCSCKRIWFAIITFTFPILQNNSYFLSSPQWWSSCRRTWSTCGTRPSPRSSTPSSSTVITIERLPFRFVEGNHLLKRKVQIGDFCDWHLNSGTRLPASKILRMGLGDPVHKRASKQVITRLCYH